MHGATSTTEMSNLLEDWQNPSFRRRRRRSIWCNYLSNESLYNLAKMWFHIPIHKLSGSETNFTLAPGYELRPWALTEEKDLHVKENSRLIDTPDNRAVENFLGNNMFGPLGTYCNVGSFQVWVKKTFKLQSHHAKMVQDLRYQIEHNGQLSQTAKNPEGQLP